MELRILGPLDVSDEGTKPAETWAARERAPPVSCSRLID